MMAGTFPGVANCQQHDANGKPLANCLLTVFAGGTTAPSLVYQDIGLVLPASNPLVGDITGRIPLFFVNDGIFHIRLTDQNGVMSNGGFDLPQVPSIGASTSGGGGSAVDPTTIASTGDLKWRLESATISGWVRLNARTIGSASSGASERANADTQALFIYIWSTYADAICPVLGGRGANGLADFNANKQITLLDGRDASIFGLDDMGNAAASGFPGVAFANGNATTGGSKGGANATTLALTNVPTGITSSGTTTAGTSGIVGSNSGVANLAISTSGGGTNVPTSSTAFGNASPLTTTTTSNNTGGQAFPSVPKFLLGTIFWKL
jgi:hypothetical protein